MIHVAGKHEAASAVDPNWASNNSIFFNSDISGYHNPWYFTFDPSNPAETGKSRPLFSEPVAEEFGAVQWYLSRHGSGALNSTKLVFLSYCNGRSKLYICDVANGTQSVVQTPYANIQYVHGDGKGKVVMLGQPADAAEVLTELTLDADGKPQLKSLIPPPAENDELPSSFISVGEYKALTLHLDNRTCHITYYAPKNPYYQGFADEKPPVVVYIHGGPPLMAAANLDWSKQFFTSRGWA
jgi:dipeptidyl aminopeptidase/acylaminoacyl peptidase